MKFYSISQCADQRDFALSNQQMLTVKGGDSDDLINDGAIVTLSFGGGA